MRRGRLGTGEELNSGQPTTPRPAAAAIVLRDGGRGLEVLLVQRNRASRFAPAAWVFPGGAVRDGDTDGRATALRELREETVVALDATALVPYSRWITPSIVRIRFDNVFFVARAPEDCEPRCDRGGECVDVRWLRPRDALDAFERGELELVFPTIKHLEQLARRSSVAEVLEAARRNDLSPVEPRVIVDDAGARVLMPEDA